MEQEEQANPSSSYDPNPCPICLGFVSQDAYLNRCFHRYCYDCIARWAKVVSSRSSFRASSVRCPLCKTDNYAIIHGYDGHTFQQHKINEIAEDSSFFTKAHKYRLQCYYTEPGIMRDKFNVRRYWKSRKYVQPNKWLCSWLMRELQALLQEEDVDIIMYHILGVVESFSRSNDQKGLKGYPELKQDQFRVLVSDAARPFLMARTERFAEEIELFLASGLTIEAYDEAYKKRLGWKSSEQTSVDAERGVSEHNPTVPFLYLFEDDSDECQ